MRNFLLNSIGLFAITAAMASAANASSATCYRYANNNPDRYVLTYSKRANRIYDVTKSQYQKWKGGKYQNSGSAQRMGNQYHGDLKNMCRTLKPGYNRQG